MSIPWHGYATPHFQAAYPPVRGVLRNKLRIAALFLFVYSKDRNPGPTVLNEVIAVAKTQKQHLDLSEVYLQKTMSFYLTLIV